MRLNSLKPAVGSKKVARRLGRGVGSGKGKTCGCGHKGQTARSGYSRKIGFEGGQTPLQRRLPRFGFKSANRFFRDEVRLCQLNDDIFSSGVVDVVALRGAGLIDRRAKKIKVILSGAIKQKVTLKGIRVTSGAAKAINKVGGSIEG